MVLLFKFFSHYIEKKLFEISNFLNFQLIAHVSLTLVASAHTGDQTIDEYPDISGITTARVSFFSHTNGNPEQKP